MLVSPSDRKPSWRPWLSSWRGSRCHRAIPTCWVVKKSPRCSLIPKMLPPWTGAPSTPSVSLSLSQTRNCFLFSLLTPSLFSALFQAARGWRSCWESSQLSWSSMTPCSAPPPWHWSAASSPKRSTRSWTPESRSSSRGSARTSCWSQLTSALSGWFTGMSLCFTSHLSQSFPRSRLRTVTFFKKQFLMLLRRQSPNVFLRLDAEMHYLFVLLLVVTGVPTDS